MRANTLSHHPARPAHGRAGLCLAAVLLSSCGGGGNPLGNPATLINPTITAGSQLSFAYFQKCINPILKAQLQINVNGVVSTNSCSSLGCHENVNGTGGALRVVPLAADVDLTNPANTPDVIRASDMYKNFYSAQGAAVVGSPAQSRILTKPQVQGVLHGGGLIFASAQDPNVKLIQYWISHPTPLGQDEFSTASFNLFTPADPVTGVCNTQ